MHIPLVTHIAPTLATAVLLGQVASSSLAAPDRAPAAALQRAPVEALKRAYLDCSREALAGRMDRGAILACSTVYEALKRRAFGGDFDRLQTWSSTQGAATDSPLRPAAASKR